jgi:predicted amidohydrolase YtcJ
MQTAEAMAIHEGKIVETGSWAYIDSLYSSSDYINAGGKSVYPGFIDPHCHFWGYGMWQQQATLNGSLSFEEVVERLLVHDSVYKPEWLCGRGWDQNLWKSGTLPDNTVLDRLFPDKPVVLVRVDGHAVLVNSKAIQLSGFNPADFQPAETLMKNGKPGGLLLEKAADFMKDAIPAPTLQEKIRALKDAQRDCFSVGLTCLADAGSDIHWIQLADSLQKAGELQMELYMMLNPGEENQKFVKNGLYKTELLNVRTLKLYADGALGSRGACLCQPYTDDPHNCGIMSVSKDFLMEQCRMAREKGLQVCTHAIGDSAVRTVLSVYKEFLSPGNDLRWRIEHAQVVNPSDINDFGTYNIIPSIQATHATSDMAWAAKRVGKERIQHAYAYKKLLEQNGWLPNGSDFPIEQINPLFGFYAAFYRRDHNGNPPEGFMMENALTRDQALKAMTIWAAKSMFMEHEIGSLEPGKKADFVILDTDIMLCEPKRILSARVQLCMKNGKKVHSAAKD